VSSQRSATTEREAQKVLTRGFTGRSRGERDSRLPPGQCDAGMNWPVLRAESTPSVDTLLDIAGVDDDAAFVLARSHTGYTTDFPFGDLTGGRPGSCGTTSPV
jgi:hypothetical protein